MRSGIRFLSILPTALLCFMLPACGRGEPEARDLRTLTIFAAASTTDVMTEIGRRYELATGTRVRFSFDASSNLARQIELGAPADLYISADEKWMDELMSKGLIDPRTRRSILANDLVLIAPVGREFDVRFTRDFDIGRALADVERIAIADPAHVPAGRYAKQALDTLGWWSVLESRLIPALDVRDALRLVEIGEADLGIVYATDVAQAPTILSIGTFPGELHEPIRYPIARCANGSDESLEFLKYLNSPDSIDIFRKAGFRIIEADAAGGGKG